MSLPWYLQFECMNWWKLSQAAKSFLSNVFWQGTGISSCSCATSYYSVQCSILVKKCVYIESYLLSKIDSAKGKIPVLATGNTLFPKCLLVSAQGWMQCSCTMVIRWFGRAGWDGDEDEASLSGTFPSSCGSRIPMRALWVIAGVRLPSWPWSWPWPLGTDFPHRLGFALSLKPCLTIRHLVHNSYPSPSLLIRYCGTVPLDEFLLYWPLSLWLPASCLISSFPDI